MYTLLIKQFFRSKTVVLALTILGLLGGVSISTGRQFLNQKQVAVEKTIQQQKKHLTTQVQLHKDDIGLLMYYLKFSLIKSLKPISGLAIGQSDVHTHIQNVSILNLEGQKYDTDLINPMRLQVGNLDFSFLVIFLFPLVIIALNFNILSEEEEKGTWKMVTIQGGAPLKYLVAKLVIRFLLVTSVLFLLLVLSKIVLKIPLDTDLWHMALISFLYILCWFLISFVIILLRKSSNANAIIMLTTWLILVVFLPVLVNNYITHTYSVEEAFSMTIKQRDAYHKKWDTDKRATMEKFYHHYPQFKKYGVQEKGFSWLWYYAMQQMGDDQSKSERQLMYRKIEKREKLGKAIAKFFLPLQVQLSMNSIAKTSLADHVQFLNATTDFHEKLRLDFYPKIFDNVTTANVNWKTYVPEYFTPENSHRLLKSIFPMILILVLLIGVSCIIGFKKF